ncbi:MAG: Calx-beta domain-containing protein, partial [Betaproteobacteria bacterium]
MPAAGGVGGFFPVTLTLGGTATLAADYTIVQAGGVSSVGSTVTINFPADGATTSAIVVANVIDDSLVEPIETVSLTVAAGSGNYTGVGNTGSADIVSNDVGISVAVTQNAAEPATNGTFTFTRVGDASGALTVGFALSGTATSPADYTVSAGAGATAATTTSITFAAGSPTAVMNVLVVDDVLVEGTETVVLTIAPGVGYAITGTNPVTMNITDDDTPPVLTVSAKTDGAEPATNGSFTITRSGGNLTLTVPVNFTVTGTATRSTDYTLSVDACGTTLAGNSLTMGPAVSTVTVTVCVIDDAATEGTETAILTLAAPTTAGDYTAGAPAAQTVNITDDDGPVTVTIVATTQAAEPATNGSFTVSRSGGGTAQLALPLTVNLSITGTATNGTDYTTIASTVIIPAAATTAVIPVTVIDDALFEGNETVIVTVAASASYTVGAPSSATVNITDDEVGLSVSKILDASEGGASGIFRVCRTGSTAAAVTVPFTLTGGGVEGVDYTVTGAVGNTITIPIGSAC